MAHIGLGDHQCLACSLVNVDAANTAAVAAPKEGINVDFIFYLGVSDVRSKLPAFAITTYIVIVVQKRAEKYLSLENALHNIFEEHILSCLCYVGDTNVNIYKQEVGFSLYV